MAGGQPMSPRAAVLAVAGAAGLMVLGGLAFWLAARTAPVAPAGDEIVVTVTDSACDPMALSVAAGKQTFRIHNASDRVLEWEILEGVMVLAERENIAPGLNAVLTERLTPGTYDITCGLLSNPRGTLTVTATAESEAHRTAPPTRAFIGPLSEYRVYLTRRAAQLVEATAALRAAVAAGDVAAAKTAWTAARLPWRQMAPVAGRFSDLVNRMDPLAAYLAGREDDPAFTGFHRLEYGLWDRGATGGLLPVAEALAADAAEMKARIAAQDLAPADPAAFAAALAARVADQVSAAQAPYAGSDLAEYAADLDGIAKAVLVIDPLLAAASPDSSAALHKALDGARAALDGLKTGETFPVWSSVDEAGRNRIAGAFREVAAAAAAVNPALGLE